MKKTDKKSGNGYTVWIKKTWVVCILACFCCLLWGSAFPFIKLGYQCFEIAADDSATQILFAGCRFTAAGILTIIFGSIIQNKILIPKKESYGKIFVLSLFQTVLQYIFFYIGLANTTGVKASIINGTNVFFAILVSCFVLRQEKLTFRVGIGCVIGFIGVILANMTGTGFDFNMKFLGEGFIILCAIAYGISSAVMKNFSRHENPVVLSGYQFFVGGIFLILIGRIFGGNITVVTWKGIGLLTYLASLSAVGYSIWGIILKYNPVSKVAIYGFTNPIFGAILSYLLLNETGNSFGIRGVLALVLVCVGIYIVNSKKTVD